VSKGQHHPLPERCGSSRGGTSRVTARLVPLEAEATGGSRPADDANDAGDAAAGIVNEPGGSVDKNEPARLRRRSVIRATHRGNDVHRFDWFPFVKIRKNSHQDALHSRSAHFDGGRGRDSPR